MLTTMRTNSKSIATMKNLFKSLMLVAVAAMAFTACQNEPEANINSSKKSVLNIEASFDQTRSGFLAEEDADVLKSTWDGNEVIGLFVTDQPSDESVSEEYKYIPAHTTLTAGGQSVNFTVEFDETLPASGTLRACSPYVQGKIEPSYNGFNLNVPTTQTPETNDVDPAAHILFAEYDGILGDNLNVSLAFEHYAAYGKMTVKGAVEAENVEVKIGHKVYTLSAENVENGVYWFACEENKAPETVAVTVNGTDGKSYTKELDLSKNAGFGFTAGRLSVFTVDMTGVTADDAGDSNAIQLTSMTKGDYNASAYYYAFTFSDGANSTFSLAWSDWAATATQIESKTYNFINSVNLLGKDTFALVAGKTYSFNGVSNKLADGSTVTVASEGTIYNIEMHLVLTNGTELDYIYNGEIGTTGGTTPADPVQLATPNPSVAAATADSVTVTWAAVANASSYNVSCGGATTNTTNTSATFTGLEADRDYAISVVAVGDGTSYLDSEMGTIIAHTEAAQGGGDDSAIYDPWACTVVLGSVNGNGYNVTLTGTGNNKDVIVIEAAPIGNANLKVVAKRDDVTGEGYARIDDTSYKVVFDVTIGGTTYRGESTNAVI